MFNKQQQRQYYKRNRERIIRNKNIRIEQRRKKNEVISLFKKIKVFQDEMDYHKRINLDCYNELVKRADFLACRQLRHK